MGDLEEVLSLDLEDEDYLYRIQRGARIVYVSVLYTALIPRTDRTDSPRILKRLRTLPAWIEQWSTLTVTQDNCLMDTFEPHRLSYLPAPLPSHQYYNFMDLLVINRINDRVSFVQAGGKKCVVKVARFTHELQALHTEITVYGILENSSLAPTFLGYVYEETEDRIVGFVMDAVNGRHPQVEDLEVCQNAMLRLHAIGIVHGDLNRYNMVIDGRTLKFIDFEAASFASDGDFTKLELQETAELAQKLADVSRIGYYGA